MIFDAQTRYIGWAVVAVSVLSVDYNLAEMSTYRYRLKIIITRTLTVTNKNKGT